MRKIYKYPLEITDTQIVMLPLGTILSVMEQNNKIVLYALVDPNAKPVDHIIDMYGTGHEVPDFDDGLPFPQERRFIGAVPMTTGLVFHIFERI